MKPIVVLLFILLVPVPALAAVIHVPADQPTIQAGLDAAVDGDTVLVADGVYTGPDNRNLDFYGKSILLTSADGPDNCVIDGQGEEGRGIHFRNGEDRGAVVRGFTIRNGYIPGTWPERGGGGIRVGVNCSPTIVNNIISGNFSWSFGGAICCMPGSAALLVNNIISGNYGEDSTGGINCRESEVTIIGNTIDDNHSGGFGAISCWYCTGVIARNVISNNSRGGVDCSYTNTVDIRNNLVVGNYDGSGVYCNWYSSVQGNIILNNDTEYGGGGISCNSATLVRDNLIAGNTAERGGGIYASGTQEITNCTIIGNTALQGGGIYASGGSETTLKNCILWSNTADSGPAVYLEIDLLGRGADIALTYSDVDGGKAAIHKSSWICTVDWGAGMIDADPLFIEGPPGEFCLSQTAAGQPTDSPCRDAGDPDGQLPSGTTRTDSVPDAGIADMGYHYPIVGVAQLVTGPGPGPDNPPLVRLRLVSDDPVTTAEFSAYGAQRFGVNVSTGDLNGDLVDEILTGPGPGEVFGPHVRGFYSDGTSLPGLDFLAYGTNKYGVNVAAGDLDGDGIDEIITGAGPGAVFGPHVRGFEYDAAPPVTIMPGVSFFAYGTPKWGVNVSTGDIDGDGHDEIITGAGPGAVYGPHVRGWNVDGGAATAISGVSFFAFGTNKFGVNVSAGDLDGDGMDEIVTGAGPGGPFGPHVRGWNYDGDSVTPLPGCDFFAWQTQQFRFGVNVFSGADLTGDGRDELVVGRGPDPFAETSVRIFTYDGATVSEWISLEAFSGLTSGVNVTAGLF